MHLMTIFVLGYEMGDKAYLLVAKQLGHQRGLTV